jgi:hypothetical protein
MKFRSILTRALLVSALAMSQNLFFVSSRDNVNAQGFTSCGPIDQGSVLFQHSDGGGKSYSFCNGIERLSLQCIHKDFFQNCDPSWNDRVSSVKSNSWVTLWSDSNFQGRCITINPNGEIVNLSNIGFEDIASSVREGFSQGCENKTPRTRSSAWVFDAFFYVNSYQDLKKAFGTDRAAAKRHWLNNGIREGRQASPDFSPKCYLNRYSDLQNAFGTTNYSRALDHYLNNGINEKRNGRC